MIYPFRANLQGLLVWPQAQAEFLRSAQKRTQGLLFLIDPWYAAATFGLAALDFIPTTGARNGEVIQMSLDADCLYTLEIEGMQRYLVRLRPKGSDKLADYIVGAETQRNLEHVGTCSRIIITCNPENAFLAFHSIFTKGESSSSKRHAHICSSTTNDTSQSTR